MGPPNGGPEGNNHEDDEVGDSDGQIWKLAVGVSVYSQQQQPKSFWAINSTSDDRIERQRRSETRLRPTLQQTLNVDTDMEDVTVSYNE
jgi:hypothetical protein